VDGVSSYPAASSPVASRHSSNAEMARQDDRMTR
jgi:hypothetical protein